MEHHGTSWDEECGKIILWKAVSIAIHQKSNRPPGSGALIPYLKVVGIKATALLTADCECPGRYEFPICAVALCFPCCRSVYCTREFNQLQPQ